MQNSLDAIATSSPIIAVNSAIPASQALSAKIETTLPPEAIAARGIDIDIQPEKMSPEDARKAVAEMVAARKNGKLDAIGVDAALQDLHGKTGIRASTLRAQFENELKSSDGGNEPTIEPVVITERERELAATLGAKKDLFAEFHALYIRMGLPCKQYITDSILMMLVSRLLDHSTGHVFTGPSSSGKSELPKRGLELLEPSEIVGATSVSAKALYYYGNIANKILALGEIKNNDKGQDDNETQMAARQLISEGRLARDIVEPQEEGPPKITQIVTEGPATFTFSTTHEPEKFCDELVNRCYWIPADDSPETTLSVLRATSRKYTEEGRAERTDNEDVKDIWRAYFKCQSKQAVLIPFAEAVMPDAKYTTARRLQKLVLDYVQLSALIHTATREHKIVDGVDYVIATKFDYEKAHELALRNLPRPQGTESIGEREDMLKLTARYRPGFDEFTVAEVEGVLGVSRRTAARKLEQLHRAGKLGKSGGKAGQRANYWILQKTTEQQQAEDTLGLVHPSKL